MNRTAVHGLAPSVATWLPDRNPRRPGFLGAGSPILLVLLLVVTACGPEVTVRPPGRFEVVAEHGEPHLTGSLLSEPDTEIEIRLGPQIPPSVVRYSTKDVAPIVGPIGVDEEGRLTLDEPLPRMIPLAPRWYEVMATRGRWSTSLDVRGVALPGLLRRFSETEAWAECFGVSADCELRCNESGFVLTGSEGMTLEFLDHRVVANERGYAVLPVDLADLAQFAKRVDLGELARIPVRATITREGRTYLPIEESEYVEIEGVAVGVPSASGMIEIRGSAWASGLLMLEAVRAFFERAARSLDPRETTGAALIVVQDGFSRKDTLLASPSRYYHETLLHGRATRFTDVRWVAVRQLIRPRLETCSYNKRGLELTVVRKRQDEQIEIYDLARGEVIASVEFRGSPPEPCMNLELFPKEVTTRTNYGVPPPWELTSDWIEKQYASLSSES